MKDTVRVSFNMPLQEHIMIKTECVRSRKNMKDYLHELVLLGLEQTRKAEVKTRLEKSLQQIKDGKITTMTLSELEKFIEDEQ